LYGKPGFGFDLYMDRYSTLSVWICVGIKVSLLNLTFLQSQLFTILPDINTVSVCLVCHVGSRLDLDSFNCVGEAYRVSLTASIPLDCNTHMTLSH
jgi:hypothetical protein